MKLNKLTEKGNKKERTLLRHNNMDKNRFESERERIEFFAKERKKQKRLRDTKILSYYIYICRLSCSFVDELAKLVPNKICLVVCLLS